MHNPCLTLALVIAAAIALAAPAVGAEHPTDPAMGCDGERPIRDGGCVCDDPWSGHLAAPDESTGVVLSAPGGDTYSVVFDFANRLYPFPITRIFLESNGVESLQRHDDYCTDDLSYTDADRDEIIF